MLEMNESVTSRTNTWHDELFLVVYIMYLMDIIIYSKIQQQQVGETITQITGDTYETKS